MRNVSVGKEDEELIEGYNRRDKEFIWYVVKQGGSYKIYINDKEKDEVSVSLEADQYYFTWCAEVLKIKEKPILKVSGKEYHVKDVYCLDGHLYHAPLVVLYDTMEGFIYALYDDAMSEPFEFLSHEEFVEYTKGLDWKDYFLEDILKDILS